MEQLDPRILAAIEKGHINKPMGSSILSSNIVDGSVVLKELTALGVTVPDPPHYANEDERQKAIRNAGEWLDLLTPEDQHELIQRRRDPPRPSLPVVSDEAVEVAIEEGRKSSGLYTWHRQEGAMRAGIRAAFPIILRDTVAALPRDIGNNRIELPDGTNLYRPDIDILIRALTGEAP